jgi:hypothetical protein
MKMVITGLLQSQATISRLTKKIFLKLQLCMPKWQSLIAPWNLHNKQVDKKIDWNCKGSVPRTIVLAVTLNMMSELK